MQFVPEILIRQLGREAILAILHTSELTPYRDAIITKKLASMAFYAHGDRWEALLSEVEGDFASAVGRILER